LASRFIDGDLPQDKSRTLRAHLESCGDCRRFVAQLRQVAQSVRLPDPSIDEDAAKTVACDMVDRVKRKDNND